jgi:hypothetical protein
MMARMLQQFVLTAPPQSQDEAARLSSHVSLTFGREEWSLVAVTPIAGGGALLLVFEKPALVMP